MRIRWAALPLTFTAFGANAQTLTLLNADIGAGKAQTIVIEGAKIVSVSSSGKQPTGGKTFDASGLKVYPGFIDGYTTNFSIMPEQVLNDTPPNSTTTAPASMWAKNRRGIRPEIKVSDHLKWDDLAKAAQVSGLTLVHAAPGSGMFRGQTALVEATNAKKVLNSSFGQEVAFRGGGGGPGGGRGYPGSLMGVIALMRQTAYDAQNLSDPQDGALSALKRAIDGQMPTIFAANTAIEIQRAIRFAEEFRLKPIIAGGREAYRRIDLLKAGNVPVLLSIAIGDEPAASTAADGPPSALREERVAQWAERADNVKKLIEAGIPFVFSSDGDPGDSYLKNVRRLVTRGLSKGDALKGLTNGSVLGLPETGAIASGKSGYLSLMSGDFTDPKSEVRAVVINGTLIEFKKESK